MRLSNFGVAASESCNWWALMGNADDSRCVFPLTNLQIGFVLSSFALIPFSLFVFIIVWFICFFL